MVCWKLAGVSQRSRPSFQAAGENEGLSVERHVSSRFKLLSGQERGMCPWSCERWSATQGSARSQLSVVMV